MPENNCGIYGIYNTVTDKYYIGQSVHLNKRWNKHRSSLTKNSHYNVKLQRSWNKHGHAAFIFLILEVCISSLLTEREQHYIDTYSAVTKGYNLIEKADKSVGWWKGKKRSDDTKQKLSIANKGKHLSDDIKLKISNTHKSRNIRPHTNRLGQVNSTDQNMKISSAITSLWTDSTYRQKISLANSGENSSMAKLTESSVIELLGSTESDYELSVRYSISKRHVKDIRNGKYWAYLQLSNRPS